MFKNYYFIFLYYTMFIFLESIKSLILYCHLFYNSKFLQVNLFYLLSYYFCFMVLVIINPTYSCYSPFKNDSL